MTKPWTGKKPETSPKKKEQHEERKTIKQVLHELEEQDWKEQLREFNERLSNLHR